MTQEQYRLTVNRRNEAAGNIRALEAALVEAGEAGTASATISAGGGSKSYTRLTPDAIVKMIDYWKSVLVKARRSLSGRLNAYGGTSVQIVRY